jgi:hypothetical protein
MVIPEHFQVNHAKNEAEHDVIAVSVIERVIMTASFEHEKRQLCCGANITIIFDE